MPARRSWSLPNSIPLEIIETTASTQADLIARAEAGAPETALMARRQTAGRGRLGRVWISQPGNLHLSILLRPGPILHPGHWSLMAGVALHQTLARSNLRLKWPNDLLLDGAKVAGILIDAAPGWLVMGIGVNLAWAPQDLSQPVAVLNGPTPTTLAPQLLSAITHWRTRYQTEGFFPIKQAWQAAGPLGTQLEHDGDLRPPGCPGTGPE